MSRFWSTFICLIGNVDIIALAYVFKPSKSGKFAIIDSNFDCANTESLIEPVVNPTLVDHPDLKNVEENDLPHKRSPSFVVYVVNLQNVFPYSFYHSHFSLNPNSTAAFYNESSIKSLLGNVLSSPSAKAPKPSERSFVKSPIWIDMSK